MWAKLLGERWQPRWSVCVRTLEKWQPLEIIGMRLAKHQERGLHFSGLFQTFQWAELGCFDGWRSGEPSTGCMGNQGTPLQSQHGSSESWFAQDLRWFFGGLDDGELSACFFG